MKASVLLKACEKAEINFFSGVPDSQLKGLCDELFSLYGSSGDRHVVAHNEGGALALCAGHYLASGHPGMCYMQNSGLGNAVNPLASLMDPEVYAMPCLLVIGWRGEPSVHDEPQHIKQGKITLAQLELMDIPYLVLTREMTEDEFEHGFSALCQVLKDGRCAAIVVRKGALTSEQKPDYDNGRSLRREDAASMILNEADPSDVFVSTTGKLSREIFELREKQGESHERDFLTVGSMGHASMIALRLAVEKPDRVVWCLDGDGAALMHLGALALIGQRKPGNLIHVVVNNGAHETVGGMPVCGGTLNIATLAKAAGYPSVYCVKDETTLPEVLREARTAGSLCLIEIYCANGARTDLGRPTTTPLQNRDAMMSYLNQ